MTRKQLNSRLVDEIDTNLRQAFQDMAQQPVPERFTELLDRLKHAEKAKKDGTEDA